MTDDSLMKQIASDTASDDVIKDAVRLEIYILTKEN